MSETSEELDQPTINYRVSYETGTLVVFGVSGEPQLSSLVDWALAYEEPVCVPILNLPLSIRSAYRDWLHDRVLQCYIDIYLKAMDDLIEVTVYGMDDRRMRWRVPVALLYSNYQMIPPQSWDQRSMLFAGTRFLQTFARLNMMPEIPADSSDSDCDSDAGLVDVRV